MFATLFVQVFGITKYGSRIGGTANFEYFPDAMYTIYQMVIGVRKLRLISFIVSHNAGSFVLYAPAGWMDESHGRCKHSMACMYWAIWFNLLVQLHWKTIFVWRLRQLVLQILFCDLQNDLWMHSAKSFHRVILQFSYMFFQKKFKI